MDVGDDAVVIFSHDLEPQLDLLRLTSAERAVVACAVAGASNGEIARLRATSARTVANLLARAYRKLGVTSRRELAARLTSSED